eukprot:COSAG06_NODE_500_length_14997_cov_8.492549_5_plen_89_part_00
MCGARQSSFCCLMDAFYTTLSLYRCPVPVYGALLAWANAHTHARQTNAHERARTFMRAYTRVARAPITRLRAAALVQAQPPAWCSRGV